VTLGSVNQAMLAGREGRSLRNRVAVAHGYVCSGQKQLQYPVTDCFVLPNRRLMREMVAGCISAASVRVRGHADAACPGGSISARAKW
jgi:hypothetical protein